MVGAGVAGLTAALQLARNGFNVKLIEKEASVGGLARSFHYGNFVFDYGPHALVWKDQIVQEFVSSVRGLILNKFKGREGAYLFGRIVEGNLFGGPAFWDLPKGLALKGLFEQVFHRHADSSRNLEEYARSVIGDSLYRYLVQHIAEKTASTSCRELHVDFYHMVAARSLPQGPFVSRAIRQLARRLLSNLIGDGSRGGDVWAYPKNGGFEMFPKALFENFLDAGGEVLLKARVKRVERRDRTISSVQIGTNSIPIDLLLWSGNLQSLTGALGLTWTGFKLIPMVLFNFEVSAQSPLSYHLVDCLQGGFMIRRTSFPSLFREENAPPGYYGVSVEVACQEGQHIWERPDDFVSFVSNELLKMRMIRRSDDIKQYYIERVAAFPLLDSSYKARLQAIVAQLEEYATNLVLVGAATNPTRPLMHQQMRDAVDKVAAIVGHQESFSLASATDMEKPESV